MSSVPLSSTIDPNLAGNTRPTERYQNESPDSEDSSEESDAPVSSTRFEQSINKLCQSFLAGRSSGKTRIKRDYTLTPKASMDLWMNILMRELKNAEPEDGRG